MVNYCKAIKFLYNYDHTIYYRKKIYEKFEMIKYLDTKTDLNSIDWKRVSSNPYAIHLIEQNIDKIDWKALCTNKNAVHLLEQNPDKIHWGVLSMNKNAIHLLVA